MVGAPPASSAGTCQGHGLTAEAGQSGCSAHSHTAGSPRSCSYLCGRQNVLPGVAIFQKKPEISIFT